MQTARVCPPHPILFLEDAVGGEPPIFRPEDLPRQACATATTISFLLCGDPELETEVVIGTRAEVDPGREPKFVKEIPTPSRLIRVVEVDDTEVFAVPVPNVTTRVSLWFSHPVWSAKVIIGLD